MTAKTARVAPMTACEGCPPEAACAEVDVGELNAVDEGLSDDRAGETVCVVVTV
jgi:hypothetical protein